MSASSTVEAERAARRWAVPAALLAGLLPFLGAILSTVLVGQRTANALAGYVEINQNATELVAGAVVTALGYLAIPFALLYLYRAVRARRPEFQARLRFLFLLGPPMLALSEVGRQLVAADIAGRFVSENGQTYEQVRDLALGSTPNAIVAYVGLLGFFVTGTALIVMSLHAMRVGLLPRFIGYVGIFAGIFTALAPVASIVPSPIILAFFFIALALIFAGRWAGGPPPAWERGEAVPWPSVAEQRAATDEGRVSRPEGQVPDAVPPAAGAAPAHPGAARRKRKKRR